MKILLVVSSYLPHVGGLQSVTSQLAQALVARGNQVQVLAPRHPRTLPAQQSIDGVPITRWFFLTPRFAELARGRVDLFIAGMVFAPVTLFQFLVTLVRFQPDVVNLHFVGAPAPILLAAHLLKPFRYVVSLHGDDVQGLSRGTSFDRSIFQKTVRRADAVTACSQALLNEALALEGALAPKAQVIVNGITLPQAKPTQVQDWALAVGRLMPIKGFDVLLDALARFKAKPVRLVLIGDGPERRRLELRAAELGLESQIEFRGAQTRTVVMDAIREAKLIVIPSRQESFGLVALEAMALGKPVVASRVGGLVDILQDADAELVPPDDAAELARAIETVLARIELDPKYGARNRARAARFSTEQMAGCYQALYRAVME